MDQPLIEIVRGEPDDRETAALVLALVMLSTTPRSAFTPDTRQPVSRRITYVPATSWRRAGH